MYLSKFKDIISKTIYTRVYYTKTFVWEWKQKRAEVENETIYRKYYNISYCTAVEELQCLAALNDVSNGAN